MFSFFKKKPVSPAPPVHPPATPAAYEVPAGSTTPIAPHVPPAPATLEPVDRAPAFPQPAAAQLDTGTQSTTTPVALSGLLPVPADALAPSALPEVGGTELLTASPAATPDASPAESGVRSWLRNPFARGAAKPEAPSADFSAPASNEARRSLELSAPVNLRPVQSPAIGKTAVDVPTKPANPAESVAKALPSAVPTVPGPAPLTAPTASIAPPPPPPLPPLPPVVAPLSSVPVPVPAPFANAATATATSQSPPADALPRTGWMDRLRGGLRKTGSSLTTVFTGTRIDEALYEELEEALLLADTGVKATQHLLNDLKRRVKETRTTDPAAVKGLLADALTELLRPLEKALVIGEFTPTVIMVAGVNGAGKTTSIGKLTRHLAQSGASVLLAAADTFRAAAREQLGVWADRNTVEIISQEGGDPAAVSFDAVTAGRARRKDVVLVDTAGRLPTQLHLMEELRKIKRTIVKAGNVPGAASMGQPPHEVLLVIDGNTGQNALAQVRSFDDALQLTGLIVTKLDGTAKGGVLAAIAQERPIPVYFIGVGEKLEDLETFNAREFAQALLT